MQFGSTLENEILKPEKLRSHAHATVVTLVRAKPLPALAPYPQSW